MQVKICGVCNSMDATAAIALGANAVGFIMGGNPMVTEIEPPAQTVREMIKIFPQHVDSIVVTYLQNPQDILELCSYVNATGIQIASECDVDMVKALRQATDKKIIKTIVVRDESSIALLKLYEPYADYLLFTSEYAHYTGGFPGMRNKTCDWELCREMVKIATKPVYLSGGLTPSNVEHAIQKVVPTGVDVATGVSTFSEHYFRKDRKCPEKMALFIQKAKAYAQAQVQVQAQGHIETQIQTHTYTETQSQHQGTAQFNASESSTPNPVLTLLESMILENQEPQDRILNQDNIDKEKEIEWEEIEDEELEFDYDFGRKTLQLLDEPKQLDVAKKLDEPKRSIHALNLWEEPKQYVFLTPVSSEKSRSTENGEEKSLEKSSLEEQSKVTTRPNLIQNEAPQNKANSGGPNNNTSENGFFNPALHEEFNEGWVKPFTIGDFFR